MECYSSFPVCIILCFISSVVSAPSIADATLYSGPCDLSSPDCLKGAIQNALPGFVRGMPALGIQPLDPFYVDKLELTLRGGLKIQFTKGITKGFRKCAVEYARLSGDELELSLYCNLTIKGKYKSSGRLLVFPIDGDGDALIKCRNININLLTKLRTNKSMDGMEYLEIVAYKPSHTYRGQVVYRMNNLIKNNPEISEVVLEFMNANWKMVAEEFGGPIVDFGVESVIGNVKKMFQRVPLNQLLKGSVDLKNKT